MSIRGRVVEALLIVLAVAVVARIAWVLLGKIVAPLLIVTLLICLLLWVLRGPHASR